MKIEKEELVKLLRDPEDIIAIWIRKQNLQMYAFRCSNGLRSQEHKNLTVQATSNSI